MHNMKPIRIGRINYTNVWPIFHHFPETRFSGQVEIVTQVPSTLNRAMAAGEIDMGPISSFAYGESFENYVLFPDLSVSALGPVNSILLFHRKPLEEIVNGTFGLVNTSATSVNLLKIILEKFYGGKPRYFVSEPDLESMMGKADGALLIGDDAIRASWTSHEYLVTDLGAEWKRQTGHWMSFAVWALRADTAASRPELVRSIYEAFLESKSKGTQDPSGLISRAVNSVGGTEAYWHSYFTQLGYDFGPRQWEGLQAYFDYAHELGLLRKRAPIRIWKDNSVMQVTE